MVPASGGQRQDCGKFEGGLAYVGFRPAVSKNKKQAQSPSSVVVSVQALLLEFKHEGVHVMYCSAWLAGTENLLG